MQSRFHRESRVAAQQAMAKFYIQSGSVSLITSADQAEQAAFWAVKRTIDIYFPVDELERRLVNEDSFHCVLKSLAELDAQVAVRQIGNGRSEAGLFETESMLESWCCRYLDWSFNSDGWD